MAVPVNSTAPTIAGTPSVGHVLRCWEGVWTNTPTSYAYQWKRAGSNISSATADTYTLVTADNTNAITCSVTATNGSGTSSATASDSVTCGASASVTWSPTARQVWEPDTILLLDPDHENKFWNSPGVNSLLDFSGRFTDANATNPWRASTPWTIVAGKHRRGIQGLGGAEQWLHMPGVGLPSDQFTVEMYVMNTANWVTTSNLALAQFGDTQGTLLKIVTTGAGGGVPAVEIAVPGTASFSIQGGTPIVANQQVGLAVTYNGTTITFYIDGVSAGTHALTAPLVWAGDDHGQGGLFLLGDGPRDVGAGTNWWLSDLRVSRKCRVPATPVTVAAANTVTFTDTTTGDTVNRYLRGGASDSGSNSTTLAVVDSLGITLGRFDKLDSALPIKSGATDGTHPTLGHSGSFSYDFRPADHLAAYVTARGEELYFGFGSCPQVLGGSVAPLSGGDLTDPNVFGNHTTWAPQVPTSLSDYAKVCGDIYYYLTVTKGLSIPFISYGNEPDGGGSQWLGTMTEFYDTYKAVADAIKAINGSQLVGTPDLADYMSAKSVIQNLIIYCGANSVPLDFVSIHGYTGNLAYTQQAMADIAGWAATASITVPGLCFSEFGWSGFALPNSGDYPWHTASNYWINDWGASFMAANLLVQQAAGALSAVFFALLPVADTDVGFDGTGLISSTQPWANGNVERLLSLIE